MFYAIPRRDVNELAHALLRQFGSLNDVLDAPIEQLLKVEGMTENAAIGLSLMPQVARYYKLNCVNCPSMIIARNSLEQYVCAYYIGVKDEFALVIAMDKSGKVKMVHEYAGTFSAAGLDLRSIVDFVLRSRANKVVLVHNHPSGDPNPSQRDIDGTRYIKRFLRELGVHLCDHIIYANGKTYSMAMDDRYVALFV